jgi:hypothetical protein
MAAYTLIKSLGNRGTNQAHQAPERSMKTYANPAVLKASK